MKKVSILLAIITLSFNSYSQLGSSYMQFNAFNGFGFESQTISFYTPGGSSSEISYNPGGGFGLQVEFGHYLGRRVSIGLNISNAQVLGLQYQKVNDVSNKSSFSFSRTTFSPKIDVDVYQNKRSKLENISIGVAMSYAKPGALKRLENMQRLQTIYYKSDLGFTFNTFATIDFFKNKKLKSVIGFSGRLLDFEANKTLIEETELQKVSGSGIDIIVGLRKTF